MSNHIAAGDPAEMIPHMKAVTNFIQQRGGIQYLGMDGILADNIIFADHTRVVIYNTTSNYPLIMPSLQPEERRVTFSRHLGKAFGILQESRRLPEMLRNVARDISLLTDIYDRAARGKSHEQEATYFSYLATAVEYQLAELNEINHNTNTLEDMLTLAFLLLNHVIFRNYGSVSPIVPILETRFWRCFETISTSDLAEIPSSDGFVIWLAFTGIISQTRRKSAFVKTAVSALLDIRKKTQLQSFQTFEQIRENILDQYLWSRPVQEHVYKAIWQEVLDTEEVTLRATARTDSPTSPTSR